MSSRISERKHASYSVQINGSRFLLHLLVFVWQHVTFAGESKMLSSRGYRGRPC